MRRSKILSVCGGMDKNGFVIVLIVLLFVVFAQSNAFNSRKLVTNPDPNGSNANQDSSLSSSPPPPPGKTPDVSSVGAPKPKDKPITNPSDLEPKGLNDANAKKGSESFSDKRLDTGKSEDGEGLKTFATENCKRSPVCNDKSKTIMACALDLENGSNNLTLMVQNEQDVDLKVNVAFGTSVNNDLQTFKLPAHATEKVNITFSGDKSNKVILNAGTGDCELQISQPSPANGPSKPKDPENTSNVKDVNNPMDSPAKPKDVNNHTDSPANSKDVNNATDTPAKPKDVNNAADTPAKPKDVNNTADTPAKPKDVNNPANSPIKPKDVDTPPKPKNENDHSNSKDVNTPAKSNDVNAPPKSKEADGTTKSKDVDDRSKPTTISANTPVSKNNVFDQLTFYSKQVTPIHGAYLAFLVALVIGGSWALCSFRKRRTGGGVPYQELEMGPSESSNAVEVETAEGWDQDWDDDDWDEDKAITSPGGGSNAKTISSNGLTSRATKKDGWDADWDD